MAAIGAGCRGNFKKSGEIKIKGGSVEARICDAQRRPFGAGEYDDSWGDMDGSLYVADGMSVYVFQSGYWKSYSSYGDRYKCMNNQSYQALIIESCSHPKAG